MSGLVNPNSTEDFGKQEYWNNNFTQNKGNFEWYLNFKDLSPYFSKYVSKKSRILVTGCGSSTIGEKMYDNGYHSITCVDYSKIVIESMKKRVGGRKGLEYMEMDVTKMDFEDGSFDVILDKACLDAIYAADKEEFKENAEKYFSELKRVVKEDGFIFTITLSQQYITSFLFDQLLPLSNSVYFIGEPKNTHLTNPLFLYITKKTARDTAFSLYFLSMHGLLRSSPVAFFKKVSIKADFESILQETQLMFRGSTNLQRIHKDVKEPVFETTLSVQGESGHTHQYRFVIWDHPTSGKIQAISNVLVVPVGSERKASFNTFESIAQVIEDLKSDRLIVVFRESKNQTISDEVVKNECTPLFHYFLPVGGYEKLNIFTPPPVASSKQIASGALSTGGNYVVEDIEEDAESKQISRRLLFTTNLKAIQSEIFYRVKGGKKKKKVFDFSRLSFFIHELMASSLLLCPPKDKQPSILVLGLGGGCLPNFLKQAYPEASITAVDIDSEVIKIAKEYFKLNEAIQTVEQDGVEYVQTCQPASYDYIFVDIDEKDHTSMSSFPPLAFLNKDFLMKMKAVLKEGGVVVYNISSSNTRFFAICEKQFKNVFKNVCVEKTKDLNVAFIATEREIIPKEQVNERRTETNQEYMVNFTFSEWGVCEQTYELNFILIFLLVTAIPTRFFLSRIALVSLSTT